MQRSIHTPKTSQQFLLLILILIITFGGSYSYAQDTTDILQDQSTDQLILDSLTVELNEISNRGHINGIGVAIVGKQNTLYEHGFGFADKSKKIPYSNLTIQNIASISKTFLGLALLKAQELGKLKLDDPVNMYLPFDLKNPYFPDEEITLRQLTTHTSSISDSKFYDQKSYVLKEKQSDSSLEKIDRSENFNPPESYMSMGVFLQKVLSQEGEWYQKKGFLKFKPGERFEYSNVGATLAAYVLERATGENYDSFSKKYILEPLNMNASGWSFNDIELDQHSILYENPDTPLPFYRLITYPDGGLITSIHDMSKYLTELIKGYAGEGTILSNKSYKELFDQQLDDIHFEERDSENPYNDEYNMGVFMGFSAKGNIGHSGGDPGVTTLMFFNVESETGQLLFVNTGMDDEGFQEFVDVWLKLESYRKKL
jgi:CubicO group peptidase (beta-lactamase class C family)